MNSLFQQRFCIIFYDTNGDNLDCDYVNTKQEAIEIAKHAIARNAKLGCKIYAEIHNELRRDNKTIRIE